MYEIRYANEIEKDLNNLPKGIIRQTLERIENLLAENPFAGEKLKHRGEKLYKYRVRDYRVIYTVDTEQKVVFVYRIRHRKDVYRGLS